MKIEEYFMLKKDLKGFRDFSKYEQTYPRGTLFGILLQKRIDNVKRRYGDYTSRLPELASYWEKNREIPGWLRLPPIMRIKLLMKALGMSKKEILKQFSNPENSEFEDLVWSAIYKDFIYSPIAVRNQFARGRVGELIIRDYLESQGIEFKDEKQLRPAKKTPDFYIEDRLEIDGRVIKWIESKALFGDYRTHKLYSKKQYTPYLEMYGDGVVIYWLGKLDNLESHAMLKDYSFIQSKSKFFLLDMKVFLASKNEEEHAEALDASVYQWEVEEDVKTKAFLDETLKLFDSIEKNIIVTGWNRSLRTILRNMGLIPVVLK
ncbi:TPD domain-containing protein [Geoglobus acetivorans]|uniref:C15orf41 family protein n=1 Tax=Geoglobus acetivorans TaxID=565033 RepID=A0ABZ3H0J1_GEOAI|nr:TPD domain-containing protein [Geoglobus acetivorans]